MERDRCDRHCRLCESDRARVGDDPRWIERLRSIPPPAKEQNARVVHAGRRGLGAWPDASRAPTDNATRSEDPSPSRDLTAGASRDISGRVTPRSVVPGGDPRDAREERLARRRSDAKKPCQVARRKRGVDVGTARQCRKRRRRRIVHEVRHLAEQKSDRNSGSGGRASARTWTTSLPPAQLEHRVSWVFTQNRLVSSPLPVETWWLGHGRKYVLLHSSGTHARSLGKSCGGTIIARVSGRSQRRAHATRKSREGELEGAISQERDKKREMATGGWARNAGREGRIRRGSGSSRGAHVPFPSLRARQAPIARLTRRARPPEVMQVPGFFSP